MADDNPRPHKRLRSSSPLTELSSLPPTAFAKLPPAILLLSLPGLLAHPPTHRFHVQSLCLSLVALRKCLALNALTPDVECRAWTALAEIGMKVVAGGFSKSAEHPWAKGIEAEVEKAISKGLLVSQNHPSLRAYRHHLALMQAHFAHMQHNTKFARKLLSRLLASLLPSDPPQYVYRTHLTAINHLLSPPASTASATRSSAASPAQIPGLSTPILSKQDVHVALSSVLTLHDLSSANGHAHVTLLAVILRLRVLVGAGRWDEVADALAICEGALGLSYEDLASPSARLPQGTSPSKSGTFPPPSHLQAQSQSQASSQHSQSQPSPATGQSQTEAPTTYIHFEDAFEATMAVHALMLGVVYHTHAGHAAAASPRLSHLHALLDGGALEKAGTGIVEMSIPGHMPLPVQVTHPRVLYLTAFLVSAAAKRDPVGRNPKRKVFAKEGLKQWDVEVGRELKLMSWAGASEVDEIEQRVARIRADLLCELIAVSIMRSEFALAEDNLAELIAHTRTYDLFALYTARIALHAAHLAHARGQIERARACYCLAAARTDEGGYVWAAARAGEVGLAIGQLRNAARGSEREGETEAEWEGRVKEVMKDAEEVARACRGLGGALEAVGDVLDACRTAEILKAKQQLKYALDGASRAKDNYLRALLLALISAHYMHGAGAEGAHAQEMLAAARQLALGLGAPPSKAAGAGARIQAVGNAPLGLWIGERLLELYKREGKEKRVQEQALDNTRLAGVVEGIRAGA